MTHTADLQTRNFYSLGLLFLLAVPWLGSAPAIPIVLAVLLAWGSRQVRGLRQYAMFVSVYAAVVVFFLPPFDLAQALFSRLEPFFLVLVFGYLLGLALDGVQDGTFWAWFAPLLLFLALPSAWGAAAVLGLSLLSALKKQRVAVGNRDYWLGKNHLVNLGLLIAVVAAIGLLLPRVGNLQDPTRATTPAPSLLAEQPKETVPALEPSTTSLVKRPAPMRDTGDSLLDNATALLYMVVVVLGVFLFRSKLEKRKANPNNSLWDFVPVLAALILATVILAFAINAPPNIPDGKAVSSDSPLIPSAAPRDMVPLDQNQPDLTENSRSGGASSWFPFVMGALALLLLYWLLRRTNRQFVLAPDPEPEMANPVPTQAASNRVRQAYLAFLEVAARQGIPRMVAETPLEFVGRFCEQFPVSRDFVQTLTNLYEPVRYGQLAAETHALQAESALAEIQTNLRKQTP
jgi:hypothetical protein